MKYTASLAAILALDYQQNAPAKIPRRDSTPASRNSEATFEVGTARDLVDTHIEVEGTDYDGRDYRDMFITAPMLAEIVGCSTEAARQRLKHFHKHGILQQITERGRETYYELDSRFTGRDRETVTSRSGAVDTVKELFATAQEGIPRDRFWELFEERLGESDVLDPAGEADDKHWYRIQLASSAHLSFHTKKRERDVSVNLVIETDPESSATYDYLVSKRTEIEDALGYEVEWCGPDDEGSLETEYARICYHHPDEETYRIVSESPETYLDWLVEHGERFTQAFSTPLNEAVTASFFD